jgi:hypothetical protein
LSLLILLFCTNNVVVGGGGGGGGGGSGNNKGSGYARSLRFAHSVTNQLIAASAGSRAHNSLHVGGGVGGGGVNATFLHSTPSIHTQQDDVSRCPRATE